MWSYFLSHKYVGAETWSLCWEKYWKHSSAICWNFKDLNTIYLEVHGYKYFHTSELSRHTKVVYQSWFILSNCKFYFYNEPRSTFTIERYLEQSKKIKQNWTGAKNFDNSFCIIFVRSTNILFLEVRLPTRLSLHPILTLF